VENNAREHVHSLLSRSVVAYPTLSNFRALDAIRQSAIRQVRETQESLFNVTQRRVINDSGEV